MYSSESVVHGSVLTAQALPAVGQLLEDGAVRALVAEHGHTLVAQTARRILDDRRNRLHTGPLPADALTSATLAAAISADIDAQLASRLQAVYNLTGTVLHTNLGRATLATSAVQAMADAAAGPNTLEFDIGTGRRGDRDDLVESLLCSLTGAEAATVVNNNAAAVLLTLAALGQGREVIVSRGELVEIGGSFRMPDVMMAAGVHMVEVGTTNRTHLHDYENAITGQTAMLAKVHTSNYRVEGFTATVDEADLAAVARRHGLPLISDLGSGSLVDFSHYDLPREPLPQDQLRAGCDVVTFSGDKLLGGPQAGLIVGRHELIERIRRHPLKRALRMGQLPMAALEATLRLYLRPERLAADLPTLRHLSRPLTAIKDIACTLQPAVQVAVGDGIVVTVEAMSSQIGSGALPGRQLASAGLAMSFAGARRAGQRLQRLAAVWRSLPRPVIGRIHGDRFVLDLRCLEDDAGFRAQLPQLPELLRQHDLIPE